jgi:hypothetical protein
MMQVMTTRLCIPEGCRLENVCFEICETAARKPLGHPSVPLSFSSLEATYTVEQLVCKDQGYVWNINFIFVLKYRHLLHRHFHSVST